MSETIQPGQIYSILPSGQWEIYLDATMDGNFGVCPQLFKYAFIDNVHAKGERPWARDLGSWWSSVMESMYYGMFQYQKGLSGRPDPKDLVEMAARKWVELDMDKLKDIHPRSYSSFGGRHGALLMIAEYIERQLPVDYSTWKIISAEAHFGRRKEFLVGETNKVKLYWMGQPDLFVIFGNRVCPIDHKSVDKISPKLIKKYKPHIQLPGYILAARILMEQLGFVGDTIDRCIVNCCARTDSEDKKGVKRPRFQRILVTMAPEELEEWKRHRLRKAERLRENIESGNWEWNEYACANQWGRQCAYQDICEKSPAVRPVIIQSNYAKREAWAPGGKIKEEIEEGE